MRRRNFLKATAVSLMAGSVTGLPEVSAMEAREYRKMKLRFSEDIQGDLVFTAGEYRRRYARIRGQMEQQGLDCLIITGAQNWYRGDEANLLYVSGVGVRLEPPFVVLPLHGDPISYYKNSTFAPPRIPETAAPLAWEGSNLLPGSGNMADYFPAVVKSLKSLNLARGRIGLVTERVFPADAYRMLQRELPHAELVDAGQLMAEIRLVKSAEEIRFLRRSAYCADQAVAAVVEAVQPGITDLELVLAADTAMARLGTTPGGFQLLASGRWDALRGLGQGSDKRVAPGDLVLMELTSNYQGYYTQVAVPISVGGEPDEGFVRFLQANHAMYRAQLAAFRPGARISEIDALGGRVGDEVSGGEWLSRFACQTVDFEQSFLHPDPVLEPGMAFVIMPWIHSGRPDRFTGHGAGNTVVCTEGEPLVLHQSPMDTIIVS